MPCHAMLCMHACMDIYWFQGHTGNQLNRYFGTTSLFALLLFWWGHPFMYAAGWHVNSQDSPREGACWRDSNGDKFPFLFSQRFHIPNLMLDCLFCNSEPWNRGWYLQHGTSGSYRVVSWILLVYWAVPWGSLAIARSTSTSILTRRARSLAPTSD